MAKAPLPENELERLNALHSYQVLDTPPDPRFDELTQLARDLFQVPVALVSLVDKERQWFKSCFGLEAKETPRKHAFCAHAILSKEVLVIENATEDPRTKDNPLVLGKPKIRFYAGAPLVDSQGFALGTLCIIDFSPRSMTEEEGRRLEVLARQVCVQLELHRRIRQADALIREIEEQRKATEGALRARSTFLASISHEIRTPITTILGLVEIITRDNKTGPFDSRQAADAIFANSKYLLEYMNCVLDLSKAESTNLPVEAAEVSIFHILQEVQEVLLLKAKEKELNLFVNFQYPLPDRISTAPIIALTATQNEQDIQELLYAGCVEYVPKPFDRHTLLSCLKRYLHQQGESSALGFELDSGLIGSEGFSELILNYVKGLSGRLERIRTALEQTDWAKLREEAHKLNAAGLFGLHRISDVSKLLEEQALRHEAFSCRELTDRLANEISSATEHVPEEIKRQIQEHKSS